MRLLALALLLGVASCGREEEKPPAPPPEYTRAPSTDYARSKTRKQPPRVVFTEIARTAGIDFAHQTGASGQKWMPETMGSGCALFDYDGDDYLDVLLINSAYWPGQEKGERPTSWTFLPTAWAPASPTTTLTAMRIST